MAKAAEAFRTISEVAEELDLHKHVLRFWEVKFPQIKPMKRGGGRRYYRPADMELLRGIRHLLHAEGYTIKGVQKILRERGIDAVKRVGTELASGSKVEAPRGGRDAAPVLAAPAPAKSDRAGQAAPAAQVVKAAPSSRRTAGESAQPGRTGDLAKAIAELQECRAILQGAPAMQSGGDQAAKSKRAMGAAG
ncbi:MAG: MerR family transcriptional regulator [Hyphomicrobiaceae bacterium]